MQVSSSPRPNKITDFYRFLENQKKYFEENYENQSFKNNGVEVNDFDRLEMVGSGSFGRVYLVCLTKTKQLFAMKVLSKKAIIKSRQVEHTLNEKRILQSVNYPLTISMEYFLMDNSFIYFVLPYIPGGELFILLRRCNYFPEEQARFYAAQVILALEYLHHLDLLYRDLKPENILLNSNGYLKITDFGFCKLVKGRTWTLCGTPDYIAPEIILSKGYGKSVDYWSFGILIFEMCAGYPPFFAKDPLALYEKIVMGKFRFASHFTDDVKDIISRLLELDVTKRYGNLLNGVMDIKDHKWFKKIDWLQILNCEAKSPHIPRAKSPAELSTKSLTQEDDLVVAETDEYKEIFKDF